MSEPPRSPRETLARLVLLLASAWVAAGALFKLFAGSPNDLPPMVRDFVLGPAQTFRAAIAIELCIVTLAVLRPRFGWLPLAALFAVFITVLLPLATSGADSCGCFGSSVTIPPIAMIAIDGTLLLLILATRPWSVFTGRGLRPLPLVPLFVIAVAAPWFKFRTLEVASARRPEPARAARPASDPSAGRRDGTGGASGAGAADGAGEAGEEAAGTAAQAAPVYEPWSLPAKLPDFHWFETETWLGQDVHDIDLAVFVDPDLIPVDCEIVLYRQTCEHCKEHLEKLAMEPPPLPLVLLRIAEIGDTAANEITVVKPADHIPMELPALDRGYGIETPMRLMVEGWTVTEVTNLRDEH